MGKKKKDKKEEIKEVIVSSNLDEIEGNKNIVLYLEEIDIKGVAVEPTRYFGLTENEWIVGRLPGINENANEEVNFKIQTTDMTMSRAQAILIVKKQMNGEYAFFISSRPDFNKKNACIMGDRLNDQILLFRLEDNPFQLYEGDEFLLGCTRFSVHFLRY